MREIKFRAWDIKNRLMYCVQRIDFDYSDERNMRVFVLGEFGKLMAQIVMGHFQSPDDYILMQYTGLKDKHGREIYEGDIVQLDPDHISEILFCDGGFGFIFCGDFVGFSGQLKLQEILKDFEILGNIYENPKLPNER